MKMRTRRAWALVTVAVCLTGNEVNQAHQIRVDDLLAEREKLYEGQETLMTGQSPLLGKADLSKLTWRALSIDGDAGQVWERVKEKELEWTKKEAQIIENLTSYNRIHPPRNSETLPGHHVVREFRSVGPVQVPISQHGKVVSAFDQLSESRKTDAVNLIANHGKSDDGSPEFVGLHDGGHDGFSFDAKQGSYEWLIEVFDYIVQQEAKTIASVNDMGVFVLLPCKGTSCKRNIVVERFYNGQRWVYVRHFLSKLADVSSLCVQQGQLLAVTKSGDVWLRRRKAGLQELEWTIMRETNLVGNCIHSNTAKVRVLFLSDDGHLMERIWATPSEQRWMKSKIIAGPFQPLRMADAETIDPNVLLFFGHDGSILEGELDRRLGQVTLASNLGHPVGAPLAPGGVAAIWRYHPDGKNHRSVFFLTVCGHLAELQMRRFVEREDRRSYDWVLHGRPPESGRLVSLVGAFSPLQVLIITSRGTLVSRCLDSNDNWIWVDHQAPRFSVDGQELAIRLAPTSGTILRFTSIFFRSENSPHLVSRTWHGKHWTWDLFPLPEVGSATYCVGDSHSPNSCMPIHHNSIEN